MSRECECTLLGPLGFLRAVPCGQPGRSVSVERGGRTLVTLAGVRHVQRGPRAPRTWEVSHGWRTPDSVAYLVACAQGAVRGPLHLLTSDAARTNLLAPHVAAPCAGGDRALGEPSVAAVLVDSVPMVGASLPAVLGGWVGPFAIRPATTLALSVWASSAGAALAWRTVSASGVQVATGTVTAAAVTGGFRGAASIVPGVAAGIEFRLPVGVGRSVAGLRLTEGPHDATWMPGAGGATVVVDDPGQSLLAVWDSDVRSDYSVTLREVG